MAIRLRSVVRWDYVEIARQGQQGDLHHSRGGGIAVIFCGIDPGLDGALAIIAPGQVTVYPTPTFTVMGGNRNRREYDLSVMVYTLRHQLTVDSMTCLEAVHSMPKQGVASSFSFGRGLGLWEGLLTGLGLPYQKVTPQRWQGLLLAGQPKGKGSSIVVAKGLFPSVRMDRVKDHGLADALLLSEYARRIYASS